MFWRFLIFYESLSPYKLFICFNISIKPIRFMLLWIIHSNTQERKSACKIFAALIWTYWGGFLSCTGFKSPIKSWKGKKALLVQVPGVYQVTPCQAPGCLLPWFPRREKVQRIEMKKRWLPKRAVLIIWQRNCEFSHFNGNSHNTGEAPSFQIPFSKVSAVLASPRKVKVTLSVTPSTWRASASLCLSVLHC